MTSNGEEATTVGSAAALAPQDTVFTQYREQGVFLFRGFTLQQMADQVGARCGWVGRGFVTTYNIKQHMKHVAGHIIHAFCCTYIQTACIVVCEYHVGMCGVLVHVLIINKSHSHNTLSVQHPLC